MVKTKESLEVKFPFEAGRQREDYGFFGPDSPAWKVWTSSTAIIGFQRAVVLEHFDPHLAAAVADTEGIYRDGRGRLDGTFAYFLLVATADSKTVVEASELLMRVHAPVTGRDPVTGTRYSANNPASQLWIHVTGWHSVLKAYEMYGPGPLTEAEEAEYWASCVKAAEFQTCKPEDVPRSRDEVRAYYAAIRDELTTSDHALRGMHYLLRPNKKNVNWALWGTGRLLATATIATMPKWMHDEGDFGQPGVWLAFYKPWVRLGMWVGRMNWLQLMMLRFVLPQTHSMLKSHYQAKVPKQEIVADVAQARALHGSGPTRRPMAPRHGAPQQVTAR